MSKKLIGIVAVVALVFGALALTAFADGYGKEEGYHGKGKGGGFEDKVSCKAYFLLKNKEELGLSDKQIDKIKKLKLSVKKDAIKKSAEIEVLALDIKAGLWKDKANSAALGKLIDKKYKLKAEKAKAAIGAYVALKKVLTKPQKAKMKGLFKKCKVSEKSKKCKVPKKSKVPKKCNLPR
ncbi:MAG: hypothetical protein NG740_00565 [Omnitrophica bacterium]|nr:hypothetical protein [Candidatus Omnitrophota bacterium]